MMLHCFAAAQPVVSHLMGVLANEADQIQSHQFPVRVGQWLA